ncbi:hypothetical protein PybrP1_011202 [[Pythium] brassicae (nom. inval.)]|nr:hypothetical protein PybrP1_011202 [[Pythium] brassicae (nom. inval.)]
MRVLRAVGLAAAALALHAARCAASCPLGTYNGKICSGNGGCTRGNQCTCDSRHTGYDCSQHRCPLGKAWAAPARATDNAHYEVECSNKGVCNRETGLCECMEGFTGTACQRLMCANGCSNAGECLSLKSLSQLYAVETEAVYDQVWDAEMIYGCQCSKGRHGFDCSKRSCPRGDDPLTSGQANEVQILRCTAKGGRFALYFNGEGTTVPFDATEVQLETALRRIKSMPRVKVTFTVPPTLCNSVALNAVLVEFVDAFGSQPPLKAFGVTRGQATLTGGSVFVATGGSVLAGRVSAKGTKEWEFCSNRGDCDEGECSETGICACYLVPMPGYRSSDGYGNAGNRGDCGSANSANKYGGPIKACVGELACNGHGYCTNAPSFRCVCEDGWTTGDCSIRTCPQGPSWFRQPSSANTVHNQWATCSDAGICDKAIGDIRQLSLEADVDSPLLRFDYGADPNNAQTYDRHSILGCKCDPGFEGYDCSQHEVQLLKCTATGGTFQLQYRTSAPADIPFDASPGDLRDLLLSSFGFSGAVVAYSLGSSACSPPTTPATNQNVVSITFTDDPGNLPALRADATSLSLGGSQRGTVVVAADGATIDAFVSRAGSKESALCSNKGTCNYGTGQCQCAAGYGSSDGRGGVGTRGDCGFILPGMAKAVL